MISVTSDLKHLERRLTNIEKKQLPFATARALTNTAKLVQQDEIKQLEKDIDRPTPFTKRAFYVRSAKKKHLVATVGIKEIQANYLGLQIQGGTQRPKGKALVQPANIRLNKYGNLTKGKIKKLLAKTNVFSANINGTAGIWQRDKKGRLKLLIRYKERQQHTKRFQFYETGLKSARRNFFSEFKKSFDAAIKTAR